MAELRKSNRVYLPGLNGIRAMAAIAVVFSHITLAFEDYGLNPFIYGSYDDGLPRTVDLAGYGVSMFFALSGFLITFLLLKEKEVAQVSVKKFYARRILRIWPLYYAYFGICLLLYWAFSVDFQSSSIPYYIFYSANIPFVIGGILPFLHHFWSLGVEEQFYMFWPWVNRMKIKNIFIFAFILSALMLSTKMILHVFFPGTLLEHVIHITRFHCMMFGGLAAIGYYLNHGLFMRFATHKITQWVSWGFIFLLLVNRFEFISFLDNEFICVITVFIIIGQITGTSPISLENRVFDFLGRISYGIYIVHPVLIFLFAQILPDITPYTSLNYFIVYSLNIGCTIVIAHYSYKYFESYFLRLKGKRFTVVKSASSSADLH